jgi:hypothetical protein
MTLPTGDCLETLQGRNWLSCLVQSSKLLLVLASTVVLGFEHRRYPRPNLCSFQDRLCVWKWGLFSKKERVCVSEQWPQLLHRFVARVYPHSRSFQVEHLYFMDTIHALPLYYNENFLCRVYKRHLSMQASAADYALTYFTAPKRQLVTWTFIGLSTAKFKSLRSVG